MVYGLMLAEWIRSEHSDDDDDRLARGVDELWSATDDRGRDMLLRMLATVH